ncbi:hypothetical protein ACB092_09G205500 [Castanea dentata]
MKSINMMIIILTAVFLFLTVSALPRVQVAPPAPNLRTYVPVPVRGSLEKAPVPPTAPNPKTIGTSPNM